MTSADFGWAPSATQALIAAAITTTQADPRILGLMLGGSGASGTMDEFSDLDFVVVCRDEHQADLQHNATAFAARIGPLLTSFTGEHVGEPRLLICLYGPPPRHVDLKFVAERDLDDRVEDGRILWQRDGALDAAHKRKPAIWPSSDPQWIEDRFWIWIHYGAAKIGRGELFECLDVLAFLRRTVLGPLIAGRRGYNPNGVRRIEETAPDLLPALEATLGDHTRRGCIDAIHAAVNLYLELRGDVGVECRTSAESASLAYLAEIERRHTGNGSAREGHADG